MLLFFAVGVRAFSWRCQKYACTLHGKFGIVAQAISCLLLPSNASMLVNHFDMAVSLGVACSRTDSSIVRFQ
ncbi:MAG TPA: hypothetical protein PKG49_08105 [Nitrosomonas mobilis]|nr:hypothetical protein [Nitrosomonas mobilis]